MKTLSNDEVIAQISSMSDAELLAWRSAVQVEIENQSRLRSCSSPCFKPDFLADQSLKEKLINDELVSRGRLPNYTAFTDPMAQRCNVVWWQ